MFDQVPGAGAARRAPAARRRPRADRGGAGGAAAALPAVLAHGRRRACAAGTGGSGPACISAPRSGGCRSAPRRSRSAARDGRRRHDRVRGRRAAPKPDESVREIAVVSPCGACRENLTDYDPDAMVIVPRRTGCAGCRCGACCRCRTSAEVQRRTKPGRRALARHEQTIRRPERTSRRMPSNTEKDPHDWITGDETMTGAQASYLKTLSRGGRRGVRPEPDQGRRVAADRRAAAEDRARQEPLGRRPSGGAAE